MKDSFFIRCVGSAAMAVVPAVLCFLFLREWQSARGELREIHEDRLAMSEELGLAISSFGRRMKLRSDRTNASMAEMLQALVKFQEAVQGSLHELVQESSYDPTAAPPEPIENSEDLLWSVPDEEALPPLPDGLAESLGDLIDSSAVELVARDGFRVRDGELTPTKFFRIEAELARARAVVNAARSRERAEMAEAMEVLRDRGEFIDYHPGEKYEVIRGAITAAEEVGPDTTRMYYFYAEQFPEIYELQQRRRREPELALRRILTIIE